MPENNEQQTVPLTAVEQAAGEKSIRDGAAGREEVVPLTAAEKVVEEKNLPDGAAGPGQAVPLTAAEKTVEEKSLPDGASGCEQAVPRAEVHVRETSIPNSEAELARAARLAAARQRALARRMRERYAVPENTERQMVRPDVVSNERARRMVRPVAVSNGQRTVYPAAAKKKTSWYFFFMVLGIPTICVCLYFTFMASPMYISQTSFAVRKADGSAPAASGIAAALTSSGGLAGTDPFIINDYIQSLDMVQDIDRELNLVKHYTARSHDAISRLWQKPTQDELLKYWRRVVVPRLSQDTGIISVETRAYNPEMAQKIAQAVLVRSEALVNAMNERSQNDAVELAHKEVNRAEERVRAAQAALKEFRDVHATLDPKTTAAGLQDIVVKLETEATVLRTKIAETSSYMRPNTPVLKAYRQRLAAVEEQLAREKERVAGTSAAEKNINSLVAGYEELSREAEFAQQQLVSAMSSLEAARLQRATQSRYVIAYQQPTLPDESLYPQPLLFTLYTFLGTLITCGLLSLIWASIREHAGF